MFFGSKRRADLVQKLVGKPACFGRYFALSASAAGIDTPALDGEGDLFLAPVIFADAGHAAVQDYILAERELAAFAGHGAFFDHFPIMPGDC